jgi:hypothetical protein
LFLSTYSHRQHSVHNLHVIYHSVNTPIITYQGRHMQEDDWPHEHPNYYAMVWLLHDDHYATLAVCSQIRGEYFKRFPIFSFSICLISFLSSLTSYTISQIQKMSLTKPASPNPVILWSTIDWDVKSILEEDRIVFPLQEHSFIWKFSKKNRLESFNLPKITGSDSSMNKKSAILDMSELTCHEIFMEIPALTIKRMRKRQNFLSHFKPVQELINMIVQHLHQW